MHPPPPPSSVQRPLFNDAKAELQRLLHHVTDGRCGNLVSEILSLPGMFPPVPDFLNRLIDSLPTHQQHKDRIKYLLFILLTTPYRQTQPFVPIPPTLAIIPPRQQQPQPGPGMQLRYAPPPPPLAIISSPPQQPQSGPGMQLLNAPPPPPPPPPPLAIISPPPQQPQFGPGMQLLNAPPPPPPAIISPPPQQPQSGPGMQLLNAPPPPPLAIISPPEQQPQPGPVMQLLNAPPPPPMRKFKEVVVDPPPVETLLPADSQQAGTDSPKRQCKEVVDPLSEMLAAVRGLATEIALGGGEMVQVQIVPILGARLAMFAKKEDVANSAELPYWKKRRPKKSLFETSVSSEPGKGTGFLETQQPVRRSRRTFSLLRPGNPQKPIPIGDDFQADVPEWTGLPNKELDESTYGIKIWPTERVADTETNKKIIGEGRSDSCTCNPQGSVECIKLHIANSRMLLKSYMGEAFISLGFDKMGEEVAESWTHEEQTKFDELMKLNTPSNGKSFMETALDSFPSKSSRDIATYYYNVYVLRRMRELTRSQSGSVDSDVEDERNGTTKIDVKKRRARKTSYTRQSQRRMSKKSKS